MNVHVIAAKVRTHGDPHHEREADEHEGKADDVEQGYHAKMPKRAKLPPNVILLSDVRERKRREQIGRNARAFLALPPAERTRQLIELIEVQVIVGEQKKPGE
jgi:hypothetical protein